MRSSPLRKGFDRVGWFISRDLPGLAMGLVAGVAAALLVAGSAGARTPSKPEGAPKAARQPMKPVPERAALAESPAMEASRKAGVRYAPVAFSELPGWDTDDHLAAFKAFRASCPRLIELRKSAASKPGRQLTPPELAAVCAIAVAMPDKVKRVEARTFFEQHFMPHRVVHREMEGLLTGYYEPLLEGSRRKAGEFQSPLFRRPPDLVTLVSETSGKAGPSGLTHARKAGTGIAPFASRAEIEAGALAGRGLELLFLPTPVDVYFLQIQGSGRIRLTDGSIVRVSYDGKNGHPYTSIGQYLIQKGLVAANKMSMGALGRWLKADPDRGRMVMNQNASYVFFKETPTEDTGPPGAIQVPLQAGRSLAVDPAVHALGSPIYVSAPTLIPAGHKEPFHRLMVAHDVGAAIKGPERGDLFFGSSKTAEQIAGKVRHPGNFFVFLARPTAATEIATGAIRGRSRGKR
jgi:membrane-bound lytic murein transglycosylase A